MDSNTLTWVAGFLMGFAVIEPLSSWVYKWICANWDDLGEAYSFTKDPTGWGIRMRRSRQEKYAPRPAILKLHRIVIVHPALEPQLPAWLPRSSILISPLSVNQAPDEGWPDVQIIEKPRLAA